MNMVAETDNLFKALGDPTRRRILQVLVESELGVSELVEVLHLPQSTVSRHLRTLRDAALVDARHAGTSATYFPVNGQNGRDEGLKAQLMSWLGEQGLPPAVRSRLTTVLRARNSDRDAYFARVAHRWDQMREDCFGAAFHLEALTALLPSEWVVADIGSGTGYLLPHLARTFAQVHAIDPVAEMRETGRDRVAATNCTNVTFHAGTATDVPLADATLDLCIASLVLHHEPEPAHALVELYRILKPGGRMLIIEQDAHQFQAFHEMMQDHWPGFERDGLMAQVAAAKFENIRVRALTSVQPASRSAPDAPGLFIITAEKPRAVDSEKLLDDKVVNN